MFQICYYVAFPDTLLLLILQQINAVFRYCFTLLIYKVMTTKSKVSTAKKSAKKSVKGSAVAAVVNSSAAAVAAGSATSHEIAVSVAAGVAAPAVLPAGRASAVVAAVMDASEIKVIELRQRIAQNWAAPEWSGAAALRASLAAIGTLTDEQINAAVAAAGRKSGEDLNAVTPSVSEVCEYIKDNFANEFRAVCGCAVPAPAAVRVFSYTDLSLSTIAADSDINDYMSVTAVPAGASASAVVAAVMSIRVLVDIKRRFAAARAAARSEFKACMASAARRANRLGLSAAAAARYFNYLLTAVPAADDSERKRLERNLRGCWINLKKLECAIVLAGGRGAVEIDGGYVFPSAGLAAVLPAGSSASSAVRAAKVRKLWARRVRVLESIDTINGLLSR